ncbi:MULTISPECIES: hypothetical protein [Glycomyces]|uniref:Uncharacterized protein n=2 Tax=Glycomyces TaxID=58113 RepID=A0A9X3PHS1_9ACTN|nr:hypothetical protein [Glycomyces lechevalierae]MDA1385746.1 hypothetical protein [Glycomyces lechevalierae]MDR7339866.1 hypothetical protein [Glycomyces lechevalierae]
MSDDGGKPQGWHWHEYSVGVAGEAAGACARSLTAVLIGLGGAFALILGGGILAEENLLGDPGLETAVDHLMRISVGFLMVFALVVALIWAVASYLREVAASRALVAASAQGASRQAVPSPDQVASVVNPPASRLSFFGWGNAVLAGVLGLVGLGVVLFDSSPEGWAIALSAIGYAAIMSLLGYACQQWLPRPHAKRRARIATHWSAEDEARAWRRAKGRGAEPLVSGSPKAAAFIYLAGLICVLGFVALQASMVMRCASIPARGSNECNEVYYSSFIERVLSWGFWIFAVSVPLAALLALIGVLLEWTQRQAERADLLASLADPRSRRPDKDVLAFHSERRMHPLARVAAMLSGAGLVFSASAYMLGQGMGLGSQEVFAQYRTEALAAILVSVALFIAAVIGTAIAGTRGRELRNALMQRWPTIPEQPRDSEGKPTRRNRGLVP